MESSRFTKSSAQIQWKQKKRKNFENIIKAFYELGSHTSLLSENSIVDDKIPLSTTAAAHSKEIFLNETAQQGTPWQRCLQQQQQRKSSR